MAKNAGMKYITITSRHHDGFSMFDSKASDYNIVKDSYGKDILKMLAKACRKHDIKLFSITLNWIGTETIIPKRELEMELKEEEKENGTIILIL